MIPNQKHLFNIPEDITYLNCGYMAPQLLSITEAAQKSIKQKEQPWNVHVEDFFEPLEILKSLFANVIGSDPDNIAVIPSVSYGVAIAARNLSCKKGQNIIVVEEQFPSNIYAWQALAQKTGAHIKIVKRPEKDAWTQAIVDTMNKDTAIVALPQCHWADGSFIDLVRIRQICDVFSSALVIDATQSLGAAPFDLKRIKPDFLITAAYKWLLGPYSLAYMYVDPKYHNSEPIEYNWINRKDSHNFAELVNYTDEYSEGATRFDVGEKSNFVLLPMAIQALQQILDWGILNIYDTLSSLTSYAENIAKDMGLSVLTPPKRAGHFLGIRFKSGIPAGLLGKLNNSNIYVSIRGSSIRVTPHLYNSKADFDKLFSVIKSLKK